MFQPGLRGWHDALTPAEINVLRLIAAGNANKQIADQLSITEETVKGRIKNIFSKLGANDRNAGGDDWVEARNHRAVVSTSLAARPSNPKTLKSHNFTLLGLSTGLRNQRF